MLGTTGSVDSTHFNQQSMQDTRLPGIVIASEESLAANFMTIRSACKNEDISVISCVYRA